MPEIRAPGQSQQVGPVTATVTGSTDVGRLVVVQVHLESGDRLADAGDRLVAGGDRRHVGRARRWRCPPAAARRAPA